MCNNSSCSINIPTFRNRIKELRENGGAYCYLGTSGDFQSSLLADAKSLKKKKEYSLLKRTLVKALERFKSYCFKRIGKAFTKLQEKNDKVNIFGTVEGGIFLIRIKRICESPGVKTDIIYQKTYLRYIQ